MGEPSLQPLADGDTLTSTLGPMRVTSLTERCYEHLKEAIITLELRPGAPLSEIQLAERFGISKSPVREALLRLTGEGFVIAQAGRKSRVAELGAASISEFYKLRMLLEPSSLHDVAPILTDEDLVCLGEFIEKDRRSIESDNQKEVVSSSEGFHLLLINRSGNQYLCKITRRLFDQANRVRAAIYLAEQQSARYSLLYQGVENHKAILDALMNREAELAADLLRADIKMFLDEATSPRMQEAFELISEHPLPNPS